MCLKLLLTEGICLRLHASHGPCLNDTAAWSDPADEAWDALLAETRHADLQGGQMREAAIRCDTASPLAPLHA